MLPAKLLLMHPLGLLLPEQLFLVMAGNALLVLHLQPLLLLFPALLLHLLNESLLCLLLLLNEGVMHDRGHDSRRGLRYSCLRVDGHGNTKHIPRSPVGILNLGTNVPVEHVELVDQAWMNVSERGVVSGECVTRRAGPCA